MARWPLDVVSKTGSNAETGRAQGGPGAELKSARFGKYILLEKLGQGGMAEVHRATMTGPRGFQKTVALKRILPVFGELADFRERFIEEARVAADLTHSNIVHVYDFGEIAGTYYISMELVDGMDADELVHLAMNVGESMRAAAPYVVAQAARGLAFAHSAQRGDEPLGLVHRDVSPQNILISRTGEVKVTDFGIVKVTTNNVNRLTATGAIMGKLRYMSPEQAMKMPLDGRSDIFALGLVLYELLTGEALLDAPSPAAVMEQLKGGDFPPPSFRNPDVPPDLDAIVANSLALDRESRYGTADDLARDLERHLRVMSGGFGREELRALVGRLLPAQAAARRERWQRQNAEQIARISPWLAVGNDPVSKDKPEPVESKPDAVTHEIKQSASEDMKVAATVSVVSGEVTTSTPASWRRRRVWMTIGAGVVVGAAIVVTVWFGRRATSFSRTEAPPIAAPLAVDSEARSPKPTNTASPPSATPPAAVEAEPGPAASDGAQRPERPVLDGKPVVTDEDSLGAMARNAGEARALANARAATKNGDRALAAGNVALAEQLYQSALDRYPGYVSAYRGLGLAYAKDGSSMLAQKMLDQYLRALPGAPDAAKVRRWMTSLARDPDRPLDP